MQLFGVNGTDELVEVKNISDFLKNKNNKLWIEISDPEKKDTDLLVKLFDLHPLTVEDILKPNRLPKVDDFGNYLFVIFHRIKFLEKRDEFRLEELNICLGKNYIITAHNGRSTSMEAVIEKQKKNPGILRKGPDFLLYEMLDTIVNKYFLILEQWDQQIDELEDRILQGKTDGSLKEFIRLKKDINRLKRILVPQRELVNKFARRDFSLVSDKSAIYFRDLYDHLFRQHTILEDYRDLIAGTFEAYLSIVSNRLNEVMKQLTIISTIFLPLTFIVGVYGMNFRYLPELEIREAYFVLWGIMLLIALGMGYYFKRKKWI